MIPEEVFVPAVRYILFPHKPIVFPALKRLDGDVSIVLLGWRIASGLRLDTWRWRAIGSPSPLPVCFPAGD